MDEFFWTQDRLVAVGAIVVAVVFAALFFSERSGSDRALRLADRSTTYAEICLTRYKEVADSIRANDREKEIERRLLGDHR